MSLPLQQEGMAGIGEAVAPSQHLFSLSSSLGEMHGLHSSPASEGVGSISQVGSGDIREEVSAAFSLPSPEFKVHIRPIRQV